MSAAGPKQHFLPAAFIGRFSAGASGPRRQRRVCVVRRDAPEPFSARAQDVGYALDLYTLLHSDQNDPGLIDRMWSRVESTLPKALDELLASSEGGAMDARTWLQTLVPFVASLFVRGPEFNRRFESRMRELLGDAYDDVVRNLDNTNHARLLELQRLYAVVMGAEWRVVRFPEGSALITNDIGYSLTRNTSDRRVGYVVPVGPDTALSLIRGPDRPRLLWRSRRWLAGPIHHLPMDAPLVETLNRTMARSAIDEIYGPTPDSVKAGPLINSDPEAVAIGPDYLVDPETPLRETELLWFEMCGRIANPPDPEWLASEGDLAGAGALFAEAGQLDRAAELLAENAERASQALGPDHAGARAAKLELAALRRRQGDLATARELLQEVLDSAIRAEEEQSLAVAQAAWRLFMIRYELGEESGRELVPRFMWLRERDPGSLDALGRAIRKQLIRAFGQPEAPQR